MKITITLPDHQLQAIRKRITVHESLSVSGFIQRSLENTAEFSAMVDQVCGKREGS